MTTSQSTPAALSAESLFNAKGIVAVVTGGGTGIGLMITKALATNGASKVYIIGRRLQVLQQAAEQIGTGNVIPVTCDVTSKESLQSAATQIQQDSGFINLLVCNSGIGGPYGNRPRPETTLDEFIEANLTIPIQDYTNTFAVNTSAVWYTTISFLKLLDAGNLKGNVEQKSQVIAISSIGGLNKINTGGFAYGQSKAACIHLIKQLSVALPQWNIRANVICPGLYPSEMSAPIIEKGGIGKDMVPLERAGDEKDMAGAVLYLASRAGAYCNGTVLVTDGGRLTTFPSTF
ncbi:Rhamnolipids biosynthesis 3-oxoacyl-[acyl-carrier-protein] reductase [Daldinia childiae]|uniref:Rhamnolipids biosynthesis 3-oxoacyl-[acyl-carrier-protein] reductase n=1 Tax=Daldinia childiae TaxID=326645 RepID=UPI0014469AF0|nr:Rhamnolipids biosynthesis 3-oxoacyl-[acyl-carrier-protein] reductase [Daldinia childiae]KAF3062355.1 Rhamnolipids biosynthesis 3-oxoacyl-[acyl-carrier-protein] reductase [Daldinia childiae]